MDLIASAERIFFRYLSQAGNAVNSTENHEIYLPPSLRIHSFLLSSSQEPKTQNELNLIITTGYVLGGLIGVCTFGLQKLLGL